MWTSQKINLNDAHGNNKAFLHVPNRLPVYVSMITTAVTSEL